jgi:glycine cleavage system aminomethyltransferase T
MTPGYVALREGAAVLDLSARGKIWATGEDRARLLHAMTTNHVQQLKPGEGCYAFFLNAQGRILGDVNLLCFEDHFLLDTEPETHTKLFEHLDRYIIADDVTVEDRTDRMATIALEGPHAEHVLAKLDAPLPAPEYASAKWGDRVIARINSTGSNGFFIFTVRRRQSRAGRRVSRCGRDTSHPQRRAHRSPGTRPPALRRRDHRTVPGAGNRPDAGDSLQ